MSGGVWADVRAQVSGELPAGSAARRQVHVGDLLSCLPLIEAAHFLDLVDVKARGRDLRSATEVCAAMDGPGGCNCVFSKRQKALTESWPALLPGRSKGGWHMRIHRRLLAAGDSLKSPRKRAHVGRICTRLFLMLSPIFRCSFLAHRF